MFDIHDPNVVNQHIQDLHHEFENARNARLAKAPISVDLGSVRKLVNYLKRELINVTTSVISNNSDSEASSAKPTVQPTTSLSSSRQ
jgi:hypothetical protein